MKFTYSIIFPTRSRVPSIKRLLESIVATTSCYKRISVFMTYDSDDKETIAYVQSAGEMQPKFPFQVTYIKKNRSSNLNNDYYNFMAKQASSDFIWACGDDTEIITNHWDDILDKEINDYYSTKKMRDKILLISIDDTTPKPADVKEYFCCFPLVSKESINILKYLFHPLLLSWGADVFIDKVYRSPHVDRVLSAKNIVLKHHSHHNTSAQRDELNINVEKMFRRNFFGKAWTRHFQIPYDIYRLSRYLKKVNKDA